MKKITFLLFTIISVSLFGQIKLTSSLDEYFDGSDWMNSNKVEYTYDNNNNLTEVKESYWDENTSIWTKFFVTMYTYNSTNKVTIELYQDYDANVISSQGRTTNTYDSEGKITQILGETFENSVWINNYKTDITYSNNRIVSGLSSDWDGSQWVYNGSNGSQTLINYNGNGTINSTISNNWDGSNWVSDYKSVYSYNANNKVSIDESYTWDGANWVIDYRQEYTYDANGNVIMKLGTYFDNGIVDGTYEETFTFDTTKQMSSFTHPFKDKTGLDYLFSVNGIVNKILSKTSSEGIYRTTYNYGEAVASVNDFSLVNFSVYPNPTKSILTIDDSKFSLKNMEVFNLLGKKVVTSTRNNINIESLVNGVYLLKVETMDGNIATKRIIKN